MTSRVIRNTRNACALAALGAALSAQAQTGHMYCLQEHDYPVQPAADDLAGRNAFANGCIRDLSDGRAAVLLPSAMENIDRVPRNGSLGRHAWGFLDQNGRVAIKPIFESVRDFRHGLAAVQWQGKWGFIDTRGRMAVRPRYDQVQDYVEIGLAVATLDGRPQLIDRQGNPVGAPQDANVRALRLSDGVPARATVQYKEEYRSASGERRYGGTGVVISKPFGQGLYVATNADGRYGVVDRDWKWVIEPDLEDLSVHDGGGIAVGYGREGAVLVSAEGKLIGADQHYQSLNLVGKAFWSAELPQRAGYAVLDAAGAPVVKMTPDEGHTSQRFDDTIVYSSGGNMMALVPGLPAPLTLGPALSAAQDIEGYVLFMDGERLPAGLLTPTGAWLHGDTAPDWLAQAGPMETRQGRLWVYTRERKLLNVVDQDGKALLKPEAVEAAQSLELKELPLDVPGGPLGLLSQGHCHCGGAESGAGLLLADGGIVTDPSWMGVIALDATDDAGQGELQAEQLRYAAETEEGMRLLDARGQPMSLPIQQHIGSFHHGYAQVYAGGVIRMMDRDGKTYDLPDNFEAQAVAPGVVRFLKTAADGDPWGLYDFVSGKELAAPAFRAIGQFRNGQAAASLGPGRVGVIDLQGKWIVPASHHGVERVNDTLWKVLRAGKEEDDYDRPAAVFNMQGRALTSFQRGLQVGAYGDGSITASSGTSRWIISPDGMDALDMKDADYVSLGDWMEIRRADRHGYLDRQGGWQIEPTASAGSTFHGTPARALSADDTGTRVIDPNGKTVATLPEGDWSWPRGSAELLRHYIAGGKTMTDYTNLGGKPRLTVQGLASAYSDGRAVSQLPNGAVRALDGKGALAGPAFDALGAIRDGLAPASGEDGYGYVDSQGSFAIPARYRVVSMFANQRAVVSTVDDSRIIDPAGETLARVEMECGIRTLYGSAGQRLWPLRMPQRCRGAGGAGAY